MINILPSMTSGDRTAIILEMTEGKNFLHDDQRAFKVRLVRLASSSQEPQLFSARTSNGQKHARRARAA